MTFRRAFPLLLLLASACADRHEASGLVLKIDPAAATVTISHDPIPNFMDAMVMPFTVEQPAELKDVRPGDRIAFRINVRDDRTEIDRVRILSAAPTDSGAILSPARPTLVAIGEPLPDFTLTNQHGQPVSLNALRGKVIAVGFIYTRCPLPDYCPRVIANLMALRHRFRDRLDDELVLLTVTFDPKHDTPEQLKAYAARQQADVRGWHFLTGSSEQIARVCAMFGVEYWAEEGLLTHTLQTAVIDREGRLAAAAEGKDFTPRQLGDLIELTLNPGR
jgi:protein SCO1/2